MHGASQILITAIAWGAGFPQKDRDEGEEIPTPKHKAPDDIQEAYNALRDEMKANSEGNTEQAKKYRAICEALVQIEDNLRFLDKELSGINLNDPHPLAELSEQLLAAIDKDDLPKWRTRIVDYNKPSGKP